jgi:hypothetical protein
VLAQDLETLRRLTREQFLLAPCLPEVGQRPRDRGRQLGLYPPAGDVREFEQGVVLRRQVIEDRQELIELEEAPSERCAPCFLRNSAASVRFVKLPRQYAFKRERPNLKKASMAALIGLIGAGAGLEPTRPLRDPGF